MNHVEIKFRDMPNYVSNYDLTNAKSRGYKYKEKDNRNIMLEKGIAPDVVDKICILTHIRHIYHVECDILFMNKEHIKELKRFLKELNRSIASVTPQINPLIIEKNVYNNLTDDDMNVYRDCIEKFSDFTKKWISNEIDKKLGTQFVEIDLERPKDKKREKEFEDIDLQMLDNKIRKKNPFARIERPETFHDYRFLNDKKSESYLDMIAVVLKKENVDKVLELYEREMPATEIPDDLSFFDSDNLWNCPQNEQDKTNEEARKRFVLARYYTAVEMSNAINDKVPKLASNTTRKTKALKEQYAENSIFSMLGFVIGLTDCVRQPSSIDEINPIIVLNQFNVNSIPGMNHGLLYKVMGEMKGDKESDAYCWYVANLASAVKLSCKFFIKTLGSQKWNGVPIGYTGDFMTKMFKMTCPDHEKRMEEAWKEMERLEMIPVDEKESYKICNAYKL